ncbi:hypothetical protein [Niabella drilacis]|uniref:Acetyltransferase (GNAT) domain-containing protein n=1 Tax=Niabella drilacis (strain DSM 25811 / CCM 8410 / CCUG 62505 / LMG 26954 / E90) TaxID=1285928 RepID=A0A1G6U6F5_NIADE|nr:hypothetical protein [Niabella drilacis]SDD36125.1 hypothetical protein SAMN04487894_108140 [Niabella drilacis]
MQIRFLNRKDIDVNKWNDLVASSIQSRIYATTLWLDHFSPGWKALIGDDHRVVMPLPVKKKYGIRYLAQPRFTQQLGLFSAQPVTPAIEKKFLEEVQNRYAFAEISINTDIEEDYNVNKFLIRNNHILDLSPGYPQLAARYAKSLRQHIVKAHRNELSYQSRGSVASVVNASYDLNAAKARVHYRYYQQLQKIAKILQPDGGCFVREAVASNGAIVSSGLFFRDRYRIYKIITATSPLGRSLKAHHFLIDELIREYAGSTLLLDFEGSNLPGVASFNTSFGPQTEHYYFVKWNRLKWPYKIFKK